VLAEAAPEIPLLIDTRERREAVSGIVDQCIATSESWVATDGGGVVAGFILVEPDEMERFQRNNHALHLRYAGVAKAHRRRCIFRALGPPPSKLLTCPHQDADCRGGWRPAGDRGIGPPRLNNACAP
jgi:hypothetical protein